MNHKTNPVLRMAHAGDAEQILAIYAPVVRETAISFELEPPGIEEMRARITQILPQYPWLVCMRDGDLLGYAYASAHRTRAAYQWAVDTTVYIDARFRRMGVGRALYTALLGVLPLQGYYNAYAGIALPNPGSVGLHEAMGFEAIGIYRQVGFKLGAWHDVGWWGRALQEHTAPAGKPVAVGAVMGSEAWQGNLERGTAQLSHG
jgi:L-amino acid N-acyltransferase YncA